jgi:hypothetical protein
MMVSQRYTEPRRCGCGCACIHAGMSFKEIFAQSSPLISDTVRITKPWGEVMDRYRFPWGR